jgi:aspartyl-tRNA(Asn)/glutamyl-tRNA(Gln) amidotransferase subunit B
MEQIKVGLEVHGYLAMSNKTKLFCEDKIDFGAEANTNICPVCTGMPGSKPMLPNREAIDKILSIAAMLDCKVNKRLIFQRKHYSWPDMPTGFQRTMSGSYSTPVGENGNFLGIGISDVHLEEDPARWDPETGCVDYNRSGLPLVEIVTSPDFRSAEEVREWLKKLMTTLSYIKAIDPDAGVKSDVNVSISPEFNRVEIKNVNSFRSIVRAIEYEILRQQQEAKECRKITRETRAWDDDAGVSVFMRSKEEAMDYMFIPEPDLPAVRISEEHLRKITSSLPEKPGEKAKKYVAMKVDKKDAEILSSEIMLAELFEKVAKEVDPVLAAKWFRKELLRVLNYNGKEVGELEADETHITQLLKLVEAKKITDETARGILEKLVIKPFNVEEHVKKEGLIAVADEKLLEKFCLGAIAENPKAVEDYKKGNEKALNFVVGAVMKKTKGTATPKEVNEIMKKLIR